MIIKLSKLLYFILILESDFTLKLFLGELCSIDSFVEFLDGERHAYLILLPLFLIYLIKLIYICTSVIFLAKICWFSTQNLNRKRKNICIICYIRPLF